MRKVLPVLLVLLLATVAFAQNKGRIVGTVTTAGGAVIPGVTVTISSDALIARTMTTTTSDRGIFRFALLPVGTFSIKFSKDGYTTIEEKNLILDFDATITVDKVMEPSEFEEVVTITGEAPIVDKTSSGISDQLDADFLQNVPNIRNVWNMPNLVAGFSGDSALGGVERAGQSYNTDGINISDPATGTVFAASGLSPDVIEQVDVAQFGSQAEYGAFTGAALNVVTKSGGNDFHGEVNYFARRVGWVDDNTLYVPGLSAPTAAKEDDPNFTLGGPVLKDKVWFFANVNLTWRGTDRETLSGVVTQEETPKLTFGKLSSRWDDRNITYASWIWFKRDRSHRVAYGSWSNNWESGLWQQVTKSDTYMLQHSFVLNDSIILEGRFAGFRGAFDLVPRNPGETAYDRGLGQYMAPGTLSRTDLYTRNRDNLLISSNYFNDDMHGSHTFKFGFEYENSLGARYYSHELLRYYRYGEPVEWYNFGTYEGGTLIKRFAGYAQDSWSISDRLTVNAGFRYDSTGLSAEDPNAGGLAGSGTFIRFNDPAYRLGFAYDLFGDGRTVVRGFAGRYWEGLVTGNTEPMITAVPPSRYYSWTGGQWLLEDVYGGSQPGEYEIDPNISNQYTEGIMVGVEQELADDMAGSVSFVYKWDKNQIGVIYPNMEWTEKTIDNEYYSGIYYDIGSYDVPEYYTNPKKGHHGVLEDLYRHYWNLMFEFNKRMSNNWSLKASYTYSRNTGNVNNNSYGVIQGFGTFNNPNAFINGSGRTGRDTPHHLKLSGTYIAPYDVYISPVVTYRSGWPYAILYYPENASRNVLNVKPVDGQDRYQHQFNIDVRLEKTFMLLDRYRVGVVFDVFNLLNDDAITGWVTRNSASSSFLKPSSVVGARYFQLGARLMF